MGAGEAPGVVGELWAPDGISPGKGRGTNNMLVVVKFFLPVKHSPLNPDGCVPAPPTDAPLDNDSLRGLRSKKRELQANTLSLKH